jgi:hypothetical protein
MNSSEPPRDNLETLHAEEERLRDASLKLIGTREDLRDHLAIVHEAMNAVFAFTQEHVHGSDDELTLQLLGIRLFNDAAASIKLALSGYYQKAFVHVRDIVETYFLVDYLRSNPDKIAVWKGATKKQRLSDFGPGRIRDALDKRDGYTAGMRKATYDLISEHASHATYRGFQMASQDGLGKLGPFMDEPKLQAWLEEMAKRFGHAAIVLLSDFEGLDPRLDATRAHYLAAVNAWGEKYYGPSFPKGPGAAG